MAAAAPMATERESHAAVTHAPVVERAPMAERVPMSEPAPMPEGGVVAAPAMAARPATAAVASASHEGKRQCPKCSLYETELGKVIGWYCRICGWRESRR